MVGKYLVYPFHIVFKSKNNISIYIIQYKKKNYLLDFLVIFFLFFFNPPNHLQKLVYLTTSRKEKSSFKSSHNFKTQGGQKYMCFVMSTILGNRSRSKE